MDDMYIITSILVSVLTIIFIIMRHVESTGKSPPLPPGPKGLPIVGYLPFLGTNLLHQFTDLGHKYGPIFKFYLGSKLCVVISSPSLVKELLRDQDAFFCDRDVPVAAFVATFGGNSIAWMQHKDPKWRAMRKVLVQELMSSKRLDASYDLRRNEVRKAVRDVYASTAGEAVDVSELCSRSVVNLMMNMVWGETEGESIRDEFRVLQSKVVDVQGVPNVSDFFPGLAGFDFQGVEKKAEEYMRSLDRIFDGVISRRKNGQGNGKKDQDFLQILLEFMEKPNSETSITLPQLKATILDTLVAGTDTTSLTIEWVMAELINNPNIMDKAQKELSDVVGLNKIVEESHIPKLKYLEAVVKESLRLHPVGPLLIPRTPNRSNLTLGGYSIPKNTRILVNVWSMHRDPSIWDINPWEFRPDRFLQHDFGGNQFQYIPFGSGRRLCPGKPLADKMVLFFLASLLHSFDWRGDQKKLDMSETFGFALRKTTHLFALPNPRLLHSNLYL